MKKYLFLFTMLFALSLNLTATEPPQDSKQQTEVPVNGQTSQADETPQVEPIDPVLQDSTGTVDPPPNGTPTVDWLFSQFDALYSILLYVIVFISGWLPFLKNLDDKRLRALIVGLVLAGAFAVWQLFQKDLTWQDFASYAFTFISTQLAYLFVVSPIPVLKTPEPEKKK